MGWGEPEEGPGEILAKCWFVWVELHVLVGEICWILHDFCVEAKMSSRELAFGVGLPKFSGLWGTPGPLPRKSPRGSNTNSLRQL